MKSSHDAFVPKCCIGLSPHFLSLLCVLYGQPISCLELRVGPTNYSALQEAYLPDRYVMMIQAVAYSSLNRGSIRLHRAASQVTFTVTVVARN
jgi:hypothetical protein